MNATYWGAREILIGIAADKARDALRDLRASGASKAADSLAATIKSIDGARRHAIRMRDCAARKEVNA